MTLRQRSVALWLPQQRRRQHVTSLSRFHRFCVIILTSSTGCKREIVVRINGNHQNHNASRQVEKPRESTADSCTSHDIDCDFSQPNDVNDRLKHSSMIDPI